MQPANRPIPKSIQPLVAGVASIACLAVSAPVFAQSKPHGKKPELAARHAAVLQQAAPLALDFDLTSADRTKGLRAVDAGGAEAVPIEHEPASEWRDTGIKREWSYRPLADGPEVIVAGLGGGKKKAGKLAQLLVNWDF